MATDDRRRGEAVSAAEPTRRVGPADRDEGTPTRMRRRGGAGELRAVEAVMTALPEVFAADLTARQRRILDYIRDTVERRGYPPTVREIGEAVGLASPSTVHAHLANGDRKSVV